MVEKAPKHKRKSLDLFVRRVKRKDLPKPASTLLRSDIESQKKADTEMAKLRSDLEKAQAPVQRAVIKQLGLEINELKEVSEKKQQILKRFLQTRKQSLTKGNPTCGPCNPGPTGDWEYREAGMLESTSAMLDPTYANAITGILQGLCEELTIRVCKEKVCVDQPIPIFVDRIERDPQSDGTLDYDPNTAPNEFSYNDFVHGGDRWNFTYHRIWRTHRGGVTIQASAELVEPAKVRQIGIAFEPLLDWRGWPAANGIFANGKNMWPLPDSCGKGQAFRKFQVAIKRPGGTYVNQVPDNNVSFQYRSPICTRISQVNHYPPPLWIEINEEYPAGTDFLVEYNINYWITAYGNEGNAWAHFNLRAIPFMNIEACTMEWPEWITVRVPEDIGSG